jgi:expansin (peptidoglycan-binding protein)
VGGTDGIVATTYRFVECGITSPLVLHNKSGTSQYWFAMQVVNASEPVASLEVSTDGGNTWTATTRTTYNYFEYAAGFRSASMDIRVTSITGATVVYSGATPDAEAQFTTSANF